MTIYETLTTQIVDAIEAGCGTMDKMPWVINPLSSGRASNLVSKKPYRGVNSLALWTVSKLRGYSRPTWATYKQWSERGASVRKGEKATHIVFYKSLKVKNDGEDGEDDSDKSIPSDKSILMARGYCVFNSAQVDGYEEPQPIVQPDKTTALAQADNFIQNLNATIVHGDGGAYYRPSTDTINMPLRQCFVGSNTSTPTEAYYSTLLHELTHWTGHKSRLDRLAFSRFGDEQCAAEELVAELGAAFLCADLGISPAPRVDHAKYIASWIKALKSDPRAIFQAASKAQQAVDYMTAKQHDIPMSTAA